MTDMRDRFDEARTKVALLGDVLATHPELSVDGMEGLCVTLREIEAALRQVGHEL